MPNPQWMLRRWGTEWLLSRRTAGETRDPDTDESRWTTHIWDSALGQEAIGRVDRAMIRDWLRELRKEDGSKLARMTRQSCLQLVRGALADAVERGLISSNPADGIRLPREGRSDDLWTYASPEEQFGLVLAAPAGLQPLLGFAMGTGMRAGELCALRWADCQLDGPKPHVVVRYGSPPDVPTKGKRVRKVPLFGLGLAALNAQARSAYAASPLVFPPGPESPPPGALSYRDPDHVIPWRTWKGILAKAGITRRFRFHDL